MNDLEALNRAVNRALRALNGIAVRVASLSLPEHSAALQEITQALAHIDALQRLIVAADPDLEYHYDPNRPPSRIMKTITDLVEAAEHHIRRGDVSAAEEILQRVQEMEPPPLPYEAIEKRLKSLRENKQKS